MDDLDKILKELSKEVGELDKLLKESGCYEPDIIEYPQEIIDEIKNFSLHGYNVIDFTNKESKLTNSILVDEGQQDLLGMHMSILYIAKQYSDLEQALLWSKFDPKVKVGHFTTQSIKDGVQPVTECFSNN